MIKLRVRYSRHGRVRFTSHRDTARIMERTFRKLRLPLVYSEGFSPRPKISFGLALSVGHESEAEYLDLDLVTPVDLEVLPQQLTAALPDGLSVEAVVPLEPGSTSLQQVITCCRWNIEILGAPPDVVTAAVAALVAAPERFLERERKGKSTVVDVRPAILELEVMGPTDGGVQLMAILATEVLSLRPSELVRTLGTELREGRVCRTHQWTNADGARIEPIPLRGTSDLQVDKADASLSDAARLAEVRAS